MGILKPIGLRELTLVLVSASIFFSGWYFRGLKEDSEELSVLQAKEEAQEIIDNIISGIASKNAEQISNIRITNKTIVQEVRREIFKEPVYTECFLTDDGLHLVNKARLQSGSEFASTLPSSTDN